MVQARHSSSWETEVGGSSSVPKHLRPQSETCLKKQAQQNGINKAIRLHELKTMKAFPVVFQARGKIHLLMALMLIRPCTQLTVVTQFPPSAFTHSLCTHLRNPAVAGGADISSRSDLLQTQGLKMFPMASFHSACKKQRFLWVTYFDDSIYRVFLFQAHVQSTWAGPQSSHCCSGSHIPDRK